jgi:hypothetical protein
MTNWYDPGVGDLIAVDGHLVERDALRIAERIKEYDSNLEILCLDPARANLNDAPFIICERLANGTLSRVFECWELDDRVLERIARSDTVKNDVLLDLEGKELIQRVAMEQRYQEKRDANIDLVKTVTRHIKSSYSFKNDHGEKVTLYDDRPPKKG